MPQGIEPSNLDKVFWPDHGLTKGDLLRYLEAVRRALLPALRDRPLTVKRYPDGIEGFSFFQKHAPSYTPSWVRTVRIPSGGKRKEVDYVLCNSARTLRWLGNQATVEFHPWLSRADRLERPDHLVMDLDPPEGSFERAREAAFVYREVLAGAGLEAAAKTSGAKGLHVYAPLQRRYAFPVVRAVAETLARRVEAQASGLTTTAFLIAERGGRVYLDAGRNAPGAHVVAAYSPRARPGATVSYPLSWDALRGARPEDFTIGSVGRAFDREGDRWRALLPGPQALPAPLRRAAREEASEG